MKSEELYLIGDLLLMYGDKVSKKYMEVLDGLLDELVERNGMEFVYQKLKSIGWTDYGLEELGLSKDGWGEEEFKAFIEEKNFKDSLEFVMFIEGGL